MKTKFNDWLRSTKPNITRPDKYSNTITTISNHFKKYLNKEIDLYNITTIKELIELSNEYFSYDIFIQRNKTGNRMYSRAFDLYIEYMATNNISDLGDINELNDVHNLTPLEKETIILSRIGQGRYRADLIDLWNGCSISKFGDTRLLVASHIKPWKQSTNQEKIDKYNGLLLLPTYDKLFDLGFISFDDNGAIILSSQLSDLEKLAIDNNVVIDIKDGNRKYLKYHRENIFKA